MMRLMASEWERIWCRKITWVLFALIPVVLIATGYKYQNFNQNLSPQSPAYSFLDNFPVLALSSGYQLVILFNLVLLILLVFSITEEYRSGQIRMVMIRSYSFAQLLLAKWLTVIGVIFLYLGCYMILSYVVGAWFFESSSQLFLLHYENPVSGGPAFSYVIRYYAIAFLTLVVVSIIVTFFAIVSQTTTTAIGVVAGFFLASFAYPAILKTFSIGLEPPLDPAWYLLSINVIQQEGIALLLADKPKFPFFIMKTLLGYTVLFGISAYLSFTRKDRYI